MKISEVSYILGAFYSDPKKAPEFAPDILHRNAIFCLSSSNEKALIPLRIRAFPNFAFLLSGAYGTRTRDPMRDRHVF